uniref:Uncharacterized protein n=1 Tax=Ixodes ricinus TaxID=34613 RepID=A0A6B0V2H8_IXORI
MFLFLLFIRVFIIFICLFILEYMCRNLSDVLSIQRKWLLLDFVTCASNAQDFHTYTENRSFCFAVFLSICDAFTHNLRNMFLFPVIFSVFCFVFLFKRAAHYLLTILLVVSSHVFTCPIAGGRHESVIVALQWPKLVSRAISSGFPAIKKLVSSNGRLSSRLDKKAYILYFTAVTLPITPRRRVRLELEAQPANTKRIYTLAAQRLQNR